MSYVYSPEEAAAGLAKLREPFPDHQISKLPKPTARKEIMDGLPKAECKICGGYHQTSKIIHLDYVGHAALTDRLLEADPWWSWEPMATVDGLPKLDSLGGLWIRLTVCGMTRLGYGHAGDKRGGDALKEVIGDALRNAAMRFGAALDLWHKGDLHLEDDEDEKPKGKASSDEKPVTKKDATPGVVNGWTIDAQDEFARLMDLLYQNLKAKPGEYEKRSEIWRARMRADHADKVNPAFLDFVTKLQEANKKAAEALEPSA